MKIQTANWDARVILPRTKYKKSLYYSEKWARWLEEALQDYIKGGKIGGRFVPSRQNMTHAAMLNKIYAARQFICDNWPRDHEIRELCTRLSFISRAQGIEILEKQASAIDVDTVEKPPDTVFGLLSSIKPEDMVFDDILKQFLIFCRESPPGSIWKHSAVGFDLFTKKRFMNLGEQYNVVVAFRNAQIQAVKMGDPVT